MTRQIEELKKMYPEKFPSEGKIFERIHAGDGIFISSACGEPQDLVRALIHYIEANPKAFFDAEVLQVWTLGVAPYTDEKFKHNFRHNSFFIGNNAREAVNQGIADYTPIFLSQVPGLFIEARPSGYGPDPDLASRRARLHEPGGQRGHREGREWRMAKVVIAQVNAEMPRVHGDTFIHISDVDFIYPCDEPLLEYHSEA